MPSCYDTLLRLSADIFTMIVTLLPILSRRPASGFVSPVIGAPPGRRLSKQTRGWSLMGDTGKSNGEPGQAPDNGVSRLPWRRRGQPGEAPAGPEQNHSALTDLYHTHHRSLLRL